MVPISKTSLASIGIGAVVVTGVFLLAEVVLGVALSPKRIEDKMNSVSGMTLRFEKISVGLFRGVNLQGLTASGANGDSFSARSGFARPDLWAGIRGNFRFSELRLQDIRFVRMERAKAPDSGDLSHSSSTAQPGEKKSAAGLRKFFELSKRIEISNAALDWMKASGSVRLQAEGIDFHYEETAPGRGTGQLNLQRGVWQELLAVDSLHARIQLHGESLVVPDFSARCGEGKLVGNGSLQLSSQAPFVVSLSAASVDLGSMSRQLPSTRFEGKAEASFRMEGLLGVQHTWIGDGELTVFDGMFKGLALLKTLGQVFQVQEFSQLTARKAHSKIRIAERKAFLEGLEVDAGDIQLRAPGEVDFKRAVSLNAQISLAENMMRGKALQLFDKRFSPPDPAGRRTLAFRVTGTLDNPKTDLLETLVGDNLGEVVGGALGGVLDHFLGGLLKQRKSAKLEAKPDSSADLPTPAEATSRTPGKPQ